MRETGKKYDEGERKWKSKQRWEREREREEWWWETWEYRVKSTSSDKQHSFMTCLPLRSTFILRYNIYFPFNKWEDESIMDEILSFSLSLSMRGEGSGWRERRNYGLPFYFFLINLLHFFTCSSFIMIIFYLSPPSNNRFFHWIDESRERKYKTVFTKHIFTQRETSERESFQELAVGRMPTV